MNSIIVNADDLGMTPGTNKAIFDGFDNGIVTHSSIMTNCDYFLEALDGLKTRKDLNIGIHLNLTYGKALNCSLLYNNEKGIFNLGYMSILVKSILHKDFLSEVEKEFNMQILRALNAGISITHIDSHRHIHLIPGIYSIVVRLALKHDIKRVRIINENILDSFSMSKKYNFILNGGLIKFILLRTFSKINAKKINLYSDLRFYSILYTGVIHKDIFEKLKSSGHAYEVMVHPGITKLDTEIHFYDENEKTYRLSKDRESELSAIL